jgi:hypothetical protein
MTSAILTVLAGAVAAVTSIAGDFDGDGRGDQASIIVRPDGTRDVIAELDGKPSVVVAKGVSHKTALEFVPAAMVEKACEPLRSALAECALSGKPRDGFAFRRLPQEVPSLALWTGAHFHLLLGALSTPTAGAQPSSVSSPSEAEWQVRIELTVSANGGVASCRILASNAPAELQARTCQIFQDKAKFAPQVDLSGRAVPAIVEKTVSYHIPRETHASKPDTLLPTAR